MKKTILALLILALMLPCVGFASSAGFGPRLPDASSVPAAGEDMAWQLLDQAVASEDAQAGVGLVMKAAAAAPESGDIQLNCAYALLTLDAEGKYLKECAELLRTAMGLLEAGTTEMVAAIQILAEVLVVDDQPGEAAAMVEKAIEGDPGNEELRLLLATTLYYDSRNDEALAALEELAEDSPRNLDALRLRATILLTDCQWEEALEAYRQIERGWPEYLEGQYGQYLTYTASGRFDRALRVMDQMILYSKDNSLWLDRARLYLWKLYDPETALAEAEALLRTDEAWIDAYVVKMAAHMMLGEFDKALEAVEDIVALDADYGELMRGIVAMNEARWADVESIFTAIAEKNPEGYVSWQYLGLARLDAYDDPEGAMDLLGKAFSLQGAFQDYDMFAQLGHTYRRQGELLEAARAFAEADRLTNDNPSLLYYLTMVCADAGRVDDMEDMAAEMERRYPGWYETMLARVLVEDTLGHTEDAVAAYEALEEKFPFPAEGLTNLEGMLRAAAGEPEGAEIIKARMDASEEPTALDWDSYASALTLLGEYEAAHVALETAVSLVPTDEEYAANARLARLSIATTRAELALMEDDMEACIAALEEAIAEGWPPTALACYDKFKDVYASEAYQTLLDGQAPQARDWDLTVLPTIPGGGKDF